MAQDFYLKNPTSPGAAHATTRPYGLWKIPRGDIDGVGLDRQRCFAGKDVSRILVMMTSPTPSLPPCEQAATRPFETVESTPWVWLAAARQVVPSPILLLDSSSFASTAPRSSDAFRRCPWCLSLRNDRRSHQTRGSHP